MVKHCDVGMKVEFGREIRFATVQSEMNWSVFSNHDLFLIRQPNPTNPAAPDCNEIVLEVVKPRITITIQTKYPNMVHFPASIHFYLS